VLLPERASARMFGPLPLDMALDVLRAGALLDSPSIASVVRIPRNAVRLIEGRFDPLQS